MVKQPFSSNNGDKDKTELHHNEDDFDREAYILPELPKGEYSTRLYNKRRIEKEILLKSGEKPRKIYSILDRFIYKNDNKNR